MAHDAPFTIALGSVMLVVSTGGPALPRFAQRCWAASFAGCGVVAVDQLLLARLLRFDARRDL